MRMRDNDDLSEHLQGTIMDLKIEFMEQKERYFRNADRSSAGTNR